MQDHQLLPSNPGVILWVLLPGQERPSSKHTYSLSVKMLNGFQCEISECGPGSFVGEFRAAVSVRVESPPDNLRLIFAGKQLQDEVRLEEYNIQRNSTINCVTGMAAA